MHQGSANIVGSRFTNNKQTGYGGRGGAVYAHLGATIENCSFSNNSCSGDQTNGGAVYAQNYDSTIKNCTFEGNAAKDSSNGQGGAVRMTGGALIGCEFKNNSSGEGEAPYMWVPTPCAWKTAPS